MRLGLSSETEIIYGIIRENHGTDGALDYAQEARVRLERASERLDADVPSHPVAAAILSRFMELRHTNTSDEIRRSILRLLEACAAVTLRESGGVYWVPSPSAGTVRNLEQAVSQMGASQLYLLPVHRQHPSQTV